MAVAKDRVITKLEEVAEMVIEAVGRSFVTAATSVATAGGSSAGAAQGTVGATAGAGGASSQTGQATQGAAGEVRVKDDVSAPEVIESFNVQALKDTVIANKAIVDAQGSRLASNNKLFDMTATALAMLTMGATHNQSLHMQMGTDHRDQNHDRQINPDEQAWAVATIATTVAKVLSDLGYAPRPQA